jgi:hypothetical protein
MKHLRCSIFLNLNLVAIPHTQQDNYLKNLTYNTYLTLNSEFCEALYNMNCIVFYYLTHLRLSYQYNGKIIFYQNFYHFLMNKYVSLFIVKKSVIN